ncbi:MAG: hypothetical protein K9M57_10075 [Phycisphaerae bacterium]|nr:hypothetical protein [Phycisphaerae bacterium]
MSTTNGINATHSLLQSQLQSLKLREDIQYRIAAKTLDASRNQGAMLLEILDQSTTIAKSAPGGSARGSVTIGAIVSGLGQTIDVQG